MLSHIFNIFILFLSIIGLIEIFKVISLSFFCQKKTGEEMMILIPICGHKENIEMILRSILSSMKWFGLKKNNQIVCLDLGTDSETYNICKIFSEEYANIYFYSLDEFNGIIQQVAAKII